MLRSLRPEDLKPHLAGFPESVRQNADALLFSQRSDSVQDRARLNMLLSELRQIDGHVRRGQAIFNGVQAACSSCHRLGYLGGDIGPDLTSIGTIRTDLDLLEAVLYPSASFVRSYEPWTAVLTDGEEHSGVLRRETPDELVLATGPGAEVRIPRSQLAELRAGTVSTMPAGLDAQLSRQDLADLLAFLKNTKWGVN
jgi:putative heme-binding domain-containing protein